MDDLTMEGPESPRHFSPVRRSRRPRPDDRAEQPFLIWPEAPFTIRTAEGWHSQRPQRLRGSLLKLYA